ncbi:hypothetical protein Dsin_027285 [Dipteronia sinensis]|uniref:hAT-like transposase RNase-H fold domain-containing protein n=1 Tax=Dipteronia sinensis TaxID=43782 RepID=A0AAD9ZNW7_9ROSI|nr:hypothetical protein Dsin_027285 [Dipteronia sinensis]
MYFLKLCEIRRKLDQLEKKGRWYVTEKASSVTFNVLDRYDYGWTSVLAIAAVLDPRFKMDIVQHWCGKLHDDVNFFFKWFFFKSWRLLENMKKAHQAILNQWHLRLVMLIVQHHQWLLRLMMNLVGIFMSLSFLLLKTLTYLVGGVSIGWRFPILARMARDFLAVSFATPHTCSFAEVTKLVNSEDLDSDIMEAFICTKSWLEKS